MATTWTFTCWGPKDGGCGHAHSRRDLAERCQDRHADLCREKDLWEPPFTNDRWIIELPPNANLGHEYARRLKAVQL